MTPDNPQWYSHDREPFGSKSMQILVPDPAELYTYLNDWLDASRYMTPDERLLHAVTSNNNAVLHWNVDIHDDLFETYSVSIDAGYSNEKGPWIDFYSSLWTSNHLVSWDIADKSYQLLSDLGRKVTKVSMNVEEMNGHILYLHHDRYGYATLKTGFTDVKKANKYAEKWYVKQYGNNPITICPGLKSEENIFPNFRVFDERLIAIQSLAPVVISSIYKLFEVEEQQHRLELSLDSLSS